LFDAEPLSELTNALQCPLIIRWWTIAVVALMFAKHCDFCLHVAKAVLSESKSNQEVHMVVSNLLSLASSHWIRCGACFIPGFAGKWLNRHMEFCQGTDPVIGKPGHLSFHRAICCCLQIEDLKEIAGTWETDDVFKKFVEGFGESSLSEQTPQRDVIKGFCEDCTLQVFAETGGVFSPRESAFLKWNLTWSALRVPTRNPRESPAL
jgi:hypothetical protein